jgi:drug/metabolite transporter (DMT)-like permease
MKNKFRGSAYLLIATIIWGSAFVAQSMGMDHIGPFTFQTVRSIFALAGLLPIIFIADKSSGKAFFAGWKSRKLWLGGALCAIPLFFATNLQQLALVTVDAGKSAFLTAMYIIIVPILGIFRKQKPSPIIPVCVLLAIGGLYCLSSVGASRLQFGDLCLLLCAFMFAVQIMLVDYLAPDVDGLRLNFVQCLFCAALSAVPMLLLETPNPEAISNCLVPLLYAGVLSMGIAYSLQIVGQKYLDSSTASLIMSLESVFAVLCGAIVLQERMTAWEILGCGLVFLAVVLAQLPFPRRQQTK